MKRSTRELEEIVERQRIQEQALAALLEERNNAHAEIERLEAKIEHSRQFMLWEGPERESTDIVKRLRSWYVDKGDEHVIRCMHEAAAEIERLKAALRAIERSGAQADDLRAYARAALGE